MSSDDVLAGLVSQPLLWVIVGAGAVYALAWFVSDLVKGRARRRESARYSEAARTQRQDRAFRRIVRENFPEAGNMNGPES